MHVLNVKIVFAKIHYMDLRMSLIRKLAKSREKTTRGSDKQSAQLAF